MFVYGILLCLLWLTPTRASLAVADISAITPKTLKQLDKARLQDLKKRINFDDMIKETEAFNQQALKETFEQTSSPIPPFFHYVWVGGPLYEEYWLSITRLAVLLKKCHSPAKIVIWVDDKKNLEFLRVKHSKDVFSITRNDNLSTYGPLLDVRKTDKLRCDKPDFFTEVQYAEYWNFINLESYGLRNPAAVSDMLRLEILRQYGGVYVDTDMPALFGNIDSLPAAWFKVPFNFQIIARNNSLIVSAPQHPLVKAAMRNVLIAYVENFLQLQEKRRTDVPLKAEADRKKNKRFDLTIKISGPGAFYPSLINKVANKDQRDKLILPTQKVFTLPFLFLPKEFCTTVGYLLSAKIFGEICLKTEEKMEDFIKDQKKDLFLDPNNFLINLLGIFKYSLSDSQTNFQMLQTNVKLFSIILKGVRDQMDSTAPVSSSALATLPKDIKSLQRKLDFMLYHFVSMKLESLRKSAVARYGKVSLVRLFGKLNFHFDCHNSWMRKSCGDTAFDDQEIDYESGRELITSSSNGT